MGGRVLGWPLIRRRNGSGRSEWWAASDAAVQLCCDQARDVQRADLMPDGRFEVAAIKGQEHAQAQHGQQAEHQDGAAVVFVHVIGVPTSGQFVEPFLFLLDCPTPVPDLNCGTRAYTLLREGGDPYSLGLEVLWCRTVVSGTERPASSRGLSESQRGGRNPAVTGGIVGETGWLLGLRAMRPGKLLTFPGPGPRIRRARSHRVRGHPAFPH